MGLLGWAFYAGDRALSRLSNAHVRLWCFLFYTQPVPRAGSVPAARTDPGLEIGPIAEGQIAAEAFERPPGAIERRFADGSVCIAARKKGRLLGFLWLHFGRLQERLVACDFEALPAELACWDYDVEVLPQYRLGRTFARLWDAAHALLRERGIRSTVSWVLLSNTPSRRSHERLGARPIGWLVVLDIWDRKIAITSSTPIFRFAGKGKRIHLPLRVDPERC